MPKPGQRQFQATPPDKGSFPLDHDGECKQTMQAFMACLKAHDNDQKPCRQAMQQYLNCRMEKQLMAKEEWRSLGLADVDPGAHHQAGPAAKAG